MKVKIKKRTKILLIILCCIMFFAVYKYEKREFCVATKGTTITLWHNYVIFEKYKGLFPPKDKYIFSPRRKASLYVRFQKDGSIRIWQSWFCDINIYSQRCIICNREEINHLDIYTGFGSYEDARLKFSRYDSLLDVEFYLRPFRSRWWPTIVEYKGDSVYYTDYYDGYNDGNIILKSLNTYRKNWVSNISDTTTLLYNKRLERTF